MSQFPLRKIVSWTWQPNTERNTFPCNREGWFARMSCGHTANWGTGPKPSATEYRCPECPPMEPGAA